MVEIDAAACLDLTRQPQGLKPCLSCAPLRHGWSHALIRIRFFPAISEAAPFQRPFMKRVPTCGKRRRTEPACR